MKYLIPNADDFGFTRDVNLGIVEAHRHGILTATTLMATGAAFEHAVELARENPELDIGVHLVLVDSAGFPPTIPRLLFSLGRIRIYDELVRQVRKVLDAGIRPTHLDTHKHTHLLPQVFNAVTRIARRVSHSLGAPPLRAVSLASHSRLPDHGSLHRLPDDRPLRSRRIGAGDPPASGGLNGIHVPPRFVHR